MVIARHPKRVSLALVLLSSFGGLQAAQAAGTDSGVAISNRATVSYQVNGVAQTPIESSPTGNSTAGAGAGSDTTFVVDNVVRHTVTELSGNATSASPGATNLIAAFTVTNTGNTSQGYQLTATNLTGGALFGQTDNADVNNLRVLVDANANGTYQAGTDVATSIDTLMEDASVTVFVLADVPLTATNNQYANVQLAARAAVAGSSGATLAVETAGADTSGVDVVFGDTGAVDGDGIHEAADQFAVQSASLSIQKNSSLISDPFNGTSNPKAIPGAVVQYAIVVTNNGASAASGVQIVDELPANTTLADGEFSGADVQLQVGASVTTCDAESPADTNGDGCFVNGDDELVVGAPTALATVNPSSSVTVRFRVTID